jgi:dolichyl-phosphate-mannose--protein O-mannosyl transferase
LKGDGNGRRQHGKQEGAMDLNELIEKGTAFYHNQPAVIIGIIVVLLVLLLLRPKHLLKLMIILFLVGAVFYIFSFINEATITGVLEKGKMVNKAP